MPVLYDEQGNPWRGAVDYVNNEAFTEGRITSNLLASAGAEIVVPTNGAMTAAIQITGTFVGTLTLEGFTQSGQYVTIPLRSYPSGQYVVNAITAIGQFNVTTAGLAAIRVRMSAFTSGSANISVRTALGLSLIQTEDLPSTLGVTITGVAGAAVTLTLPAPGVGLFQIVDYIEVVHFAAATGVAAATPTLVTTTNTPGALVLSFRADAFVQGSREVITIGNGVPFKAAAANTGLTVSMPVTTSVLWRANAVYRVGV